MQERRREFIVYIGTERVSEVDYCLYLLVAEDLLGAANGRSVVCGRALSGSVAVESDAWEVGSSAAGRTQ